MSAAIFNAAPPAAPDDPPNTTAPAANRKFRLPRPQGGYSPSLWLVATGGGCTVVLWAYEPTLKRWMQCGAAVALLADAAQVGAGMAGATVPTDMDLFLQVTVVGTASMVAAGTLLPGGGSRAPPGLSRRRRRRGAVLGAARGSGACRTGTHRGGPCRTGVPRKKKFRISSSAP